MQQVPFVAEEVEQQHSQGASFAQQRRMQLEDEQHQNIVAHCDYTRSQTPASPVSEDPAEERGLR